MAFSWPNLSVEYNSLRAIRRCANQEPPPSGRSAQPLEIDDCCIADAHSLKSVERHATARIAPLESMNVLSCFCDQLVVCHNQRCAAEREAEPQPLGTRRRRNWGAANLPQQPQTEGLAAGGSGAKLDGFT